MLRKGSEENARAIRVVPATRNGYRLGHSFCGGLSWTRLWLLGMLGFLISISFGVAWARIRDDIQEASRLHLV